MHLSSVDTLATGMKKGMPNSLKLVSLEEHSIQQAEADCNKTTLRQI